MKLRKYFLRRLYSTIHLICVTVASFWRVSAVLIAYVFYVCKKVFSSLPNSTYNILNVVNKSSDAVVWWARANSIYYRISSKHIWTWLNCPIHMNYFCDVFVNFLKHQNYGGMDFPWRDRNLLVSIKMSSFVFWWWTKVLWVWMTWGWVNDRIYFSEWQTLWVNSQVVMWTNG